MHFLITLPAEEWSNGFAEIIKYACIFDKEMFEELARNDISYYRNSTSALRSLIERCAGWKNKTVIEDEREKGVRKLLNFGHTAGHAIETLYKLPHGQAVAIGMMIAATISEQVTGFAPAEKNRLKDMLLRYQLPVLYKIDVAQTMELLKMDKKRRNDQVDYILLRDVGEAIIKPLSFEVIEKALMSCAQ